MIASFQQFWARHPIVGTLLAIVAGIFLLGLVTASLKLIFVLIVAAAVITVARGLYSGCCKMFADPPQDSLQR